MATPARAPRRCSPVVGGRGRTYQGYVKARRQISRRQIRITKRTLRRYHRRIAGPFWRRNGWQAFSADGTRIGLTRTAANEKAFGCAGRDKSAPQLALTDRQIGQFYRMRWGQEVFHRSFKQTLQQHTMRSGSQGEARREPDWALMACLILGLRSVQAQIEAHRDPLTWSVASGRRAWVSRSSGDPVTQGREGRLHAKGVEGHPPLASQETRSPAGAAEVAPGRPARKTPCHRTSRKDQGHLSSRRCVPPRAERKKSTSAITRGYPHQRRQYRPCEQEEL